MGRVDRTLLFVLVAFFALPAAAQTVYKCRDGKGQPVYQSAPCAGDAMPERVWSGTYRQPTYAERLAREQRDREFEQRRRLDRARRARPVYIEPSSTGSMRSSCAAVRAEYDRVQADFRANRNVDLLRRLEAQLRRCSLGVPGGR